MQDIRHKTGTKYRGKTLEARAKNKQEIVQGLSNEMGIKSSVLHLVSKSLKKGDKDIRD